MNIGTTRHYIKIHLKMGNCAVFHSPNLYYCRDTKTSQLTNTFSRHNAPPTQATECLSKISLCAPSVPSDHKIFIITFFISHSVAIVRDDHLIYRPKRPSHWK